MHNKLRQHFDKVVLFSDEEFEFVLSHFSSQRVKKRNYLIQEGKKVTHLYFVISGLLKLIYNDSEGREHIVSFALEDWWESDFSAFYSRGNATLSLQALEDTEVYCITHSNYQKLLLGFQKMERFFLEKASRGHIGSQQRIISFLTLSAAERYEHFLQRYPALLQRVPKTLIASYLGVSRETLSRLIS